MKRERIVAANWKMNLNWVDAFDLATAIKTQCATTEVKKIIFPPFPYIQMCSVILEGMKDFSTGAQDCSAQAKGAYTGEVSASMIFSSGGRHVIVGHSERRQHHGETPQMLRSKIEQALSAGLHVIYCFGELLPERKEGRHFEVADAQLRDTLTGLPEAALEKIVLAYEPVWAIGTGETATPSQAQEMHAHVRQQVGKMFSNAAAERVSILYGGSCNSGNARELFACPDIDGGLIGGASLKAQEFCTIASSFQ